MYEGSLPPHRPLIFTPELQRIHQLADIAAYEIRHARFSRKEMREALHEIMEIVDAVIGPQERTCMKPLEKYR